MMPDWDADRGENAVRHRILPNVITAIHHLTLSRCLSAAIQNYCSMVGDCTLVAKGPKAVSIEAPILSPAAIRCSYKGSSGRLRFRGSHFGQSYRSCSLDLCHMAIANVHFFSQTFFPATHVWRISPSSLRMTRSARRPASSLPRVLSPIISATFSVTHLTASATPQPLQRIMF